MSADQTTGLATKRPRSRLFSLGATGGALEGVSQVARYVPFVFGVSAAHADDVTLS